MNICLLGLSGSGKTCYLYTISQVLSTGISVDGHIISATCTNRRKKLKLNKGIEQMAEGKWPDGSVNTINYPFELKIDGRVQGNFTIYDYRGGVLDGTSNNDNDEAEELFNTFDDSNCVIFLIDGDTLLSALDPQNIELKHREVSFQSQLVARNKINYIESLIRECSGRFKRNVPIILAITKKDIFSDGELDAGYNLLRRLLPTVFSIHNDMIVGITSVTLGKNLQNTNGQLIGTLYLNTEGNIHLPVLFALLQEIDGQEDVFNNLEEMKSLICKLFTSDRISFYRAGRTAVIL